MGKQLPLFEQTRDHNDRLNEAQAKMRLEAAAREATKPVFKPRHGRSVGRACPSCGAYVTIPV